LGSVSQLPLWPQPPDDDPLGEPERRRIRRDFWEAIGSGQAGLALLVIGVLSAVAATWVAQEHHLDVLATAEWAVGLGLGIPLVLCIIVFFRIAFRVPRRQRDEARAAYVLQREAAEANLVIDLKDGVALGEVESEAVLQPKVRIRNTGTNPAPIHDWRAVLSVGDERHSLRHNVGPPLIGGSYELPLLDRLGPFSPGLTSGYLQFVVPGVSQGALHEVLDAAETPMMLTVEAYGPVQRWEGEFDFRADYARPRKKVDAQPPHERLRVLSREGHQLLGEVPQQPTPARLARLEPRIDQWADRVREFLFAQRPELLVVLC